MPSNLVFLKRSFRLLVRKYLVQIRLKLSQFKRMCLTVKGTLHIEHIGMSSLFRHERVMGVWSIQSQESIIFLSS